MVDPNITPLQRYGRETFLARLKPRGIEKFDPGVAHGSHRPYARVTGFVLFFSPKNLY
jgi:hypothetical protein